MFNNPQDFLKVLIAHHKEIATASDGCATLKDYEHASNFAKQPDLRAAASIAVKHFNEIAMLDDTSPLGWQNNHVQLSTLKHGLKYSEGKSLSSEIAWNETKNVLGTILAGGGTAALAVMTVGTSESVVFAGLIGTATVEMGALTGILAYDSYKYPSNLRARAADTRTRLQSWPEINKELRYKQS